DFGLFVHQTLIDLSHDYGIAFGIGNHEEFDWGINGNWLFALHHQALVDEISAIQGTPFKALVANLHRTELGDKLLANSRDFSVGGKKLRFVGLMLDNFFSLSKYDRVKAPQLFTGQANMRKAAEDELAQAAKDGVDQLIFLCHAN